MGVEDVGKLRKGRAEGGGKKRKQQKKRVKKKKKFVENGRNRESGK
jgi:hypothetical protein